MQIEILFAEKNLIWLSAAENFTQCTMPYLS